MSELGNAENFMQHEVNISIHNVGFDENGDQETNEKQQDKEPEQPVEKKWPSPQSRNEEEQATPPTPKSQMKNSKKKNGNYQFPMKGRQLPTVQSNDLFYNPNHTANKDKSPRVVFGKAQKYFDLKAKELNQKQGPSTYRPNDNITKRAQPCFSMSKSNKKCHFDKTLGEGAQKFYNTQRDFGNDTRHGYMMKSSRTTNESSTKPAPGSYNAKNSLTEPQQISHRFPQSPKDCMKQMLRTTDPDIQVGPGSYNQLNATSSLKNLRPKGGVIGSARKNNLEINETPAPGQYDNCKTSRNIVKRCASFGRANLNESIRSDIVPCGNLGYIRRTRINSSSLGPDLGPGTYNTQDSRLTGRTVKNPLQGGFTFQKQKKYLRHTNSTMSLIGPANYNSNLELPKISKYSNSNRHGVIAKSGQHTERLSFQPRESPDPGKYQDKVQEFIISPINIKFEKSQKVSTEREQSPGPGHYDVIDALTRRKIKPKTFTQSVRNLNQYLTKNLVKTPGPGHYDNIDKACKKISTDCKIPKATRKELKNENPGPGHYQPNVNVVKAKIPSAKIALDQVDQLIIDLNKKIKQVRQPMFSPVLQKQMDDGKVQQLNHGLSQTMKKPMNEQGYEKQQRILSSTGDKYHRTTGTHSQSTKSNSIMQSQTTRYLSNLNCKDVENYTNDMYPDQQDQLPASEQNFEGGNNRKKIYQETY